MLGCFFAALGVLAWVCVFAYYGRDLPTVSTLKHYAPPQISRVLDRKGHVIAESFTERRTVVPMSRIPRVLVLSVLAAEDADFYRHTGLDYAGIARALIYDTLRGRPTQGASTITQQIVKNLLLTPERTIARKVRELILARRLEQELGKDQILFLYLNHINFGHGRYGVEEASRFYFGKHVDELTLAEASLIAGIPQAPSRLSPMLHPEAARKRQLYVLDQLEHKRAQYWDDLPEASIAQARREPVQVRSPQDAAEPAPEAAQQARDMLRELVGAEAAAHGGYTIETTLDATLEIAARQALRNGLVHVDERQKLQAPLRAKKGEARPERVPALSAGKSYEAVVQGGDDANGRILLDVGGHKAIAQLADAARWNPKGLSARTFAELGARVHVTVESVDADGAPAHVRMRLGPQGAVVVIDPRTRDVLVLVGADEASYGFNRASFAVRQPGSTWKPVEYALALDTRTFTAASVVLDAPEVYDQWKPNNFETWEYTGAVRLREALAQSINLVAVRVTSELTPPKVVEFARKLGISTELDPSLALALGASGVKPIELVNAYATFAAGGRFSATRLVKRVLGPDGKEFALPRRAPPAEVLSPAAAYVLTSMLTSVVKTGTGKAAAVALQRPAAGKTGTSNRLRDTWFVGYTPELVAGVWVGYDDLRSLGKGESGANTALPIWIELMKLALKDRPAVDFPIPKGVVTAKIDPKTGKLAYEGQPDALDEVFVEGTVPTEVATPADVIDTGTFLMEQSGGGPGPAKAAPRP
ncbi:MAG TPA: PBP1A family penicillin-binding protein [Polyangiales bacterium]